MVSFAAMFRRSNLWGVDRAEVGSICPLDYLALRSLVAMINETSVVWVTFEMALKI